MKKDLIKTLILMILLGLLIIGIIEVFRGLQITNAPDMDQGDTEVIVLKVAWWGSELRNSRTLEVVNLFMEQYPHIKVEVEFSEFETYWNTLASQAALGNLPDVIQQDYKYIERYVEKGLLVSLNDFIDSGLLDISYIAPSIIETSTFMDQIYGVCLGINTQTMFYHPSILSEAGISLNEMMTWEEYESVCQVIYEKTGAYTSPIYINDVLRGIELFVRNAGYALYNEDKKTLGFEDYEIIEAYFTLIKEQVDLGISTPVQYNMPNKASSETTFLKKIDWNEFGWSNGVANVEELLGDVVGIQMMPQDQEAVQNSHYMKPAMFFSVTESSKQKEAAVLFVDYFTNSIEANKVLLGERGVPASSKVREAIEGDMPKSEAQIFEFVSKVEEYASSIDAAEPGGAAEITEAVTDLLNRVLYSELLPEDAAREFMMKANAILAKNN